MTAGEKTLSFAAVAAVFLGSFWLGRLTERKDIAVAETATVTDTLVVRDTVLIDRPVEVERRIVKTEYVPVRDTVSLHDTLYLRLPREQRMYGGEDYTAYVSGISPVLDSIQVFPKTSYITNTVTQAARKRQCGLGIQAGCGFSSKGLAPYIGIGVSYNILTW